MYSAEDCKIKVTRGINGLYTGSAMDKNKEYIVTVHGYATFSAAYEAVMAALSKLKP